MGDSDSGDTLSLTSPSGARKRPRNEEKWKKKVAKKEHNLTKPMPINIKLAIHKEIILEKTFFYSLRTKLIIEEDVQ